MTVSELIKSLQQCPADYECSIKIIKEEEEDSLEVLYESVAIDHQNSSVIIVGFWE